MWFSLGSPPSASSHSLTPSSPVTPVADTTRSALASPVRASPVTGLCTSPSCNVRSTVDASATASSSALRTAAVTSFSTPSHSSAAANPSASFAPRPWPAPACCNRIVSARCSRASPRFSSASPGSPGNLCRLTCACDATGCLLARTPGYRYHPRPRPGMLRPLPPAQAPLRLTPCFSTGFHPPSLSLPRLAPSTAEPLLLHTRRTHGAGLAKAAKGCDSMLCTVIDCSRARFWHAGKRWHKTRPAGSILCQPDSRALSGCWRSLHRSATHGVRAACRRSPAWSPFVPGPVSPCDG